MKFIVVKFGANGNRLYICSVLVVSYTKTMRQTNNIIYMKTAMYRFGATLLAALFALVAPVAAQTKFDVTGGVDNGEVLRLHTPR